MNRPMGRCNQFKDCRKPAYAVIDRADWKTPARFCKEHSWGVIP